MKYLYLDDLVSIFNKSWSFCQKEVSVGRLKAEKKYHLWKQRYLITEKDLLEYLQNNQDRVWAIDDNKVSELSFNLNEIRTIEKEKKENAPIKMTYQEETNEAIQESSFVYKEKGDQDMAKYYQVLQDITATLEELKKNSWTEGNKLYVEELNKNLDLLRTEKDNIKTEYELKIDKIEREKESLTKEFKEEKDKLNEELKNEIKKSERVYFLSDRYDKMISSNRLAIEKMLELSKMISWGQKIKLVEMKKLITAMSSSRKIEVLDEGIKEDFIMEETLFDEISSLDDNIELEISREGEIKLLSEENKKYKRKSYWTLWSTIMLTVILIVILALRFFHLV